MSQQNPPVLNGPNAGIPDDKVGQDMRPPLNRLDSRTNFPNAFRPPFPQAPPRPPQVRQTSPTPVPQLPFPQRPPQPQQVQRPPPPPAAAFQQPRANFRPLAPFPRPQPPPAPPRGPPFQQRPFVRPVFSEEGLNRSQTLDTAEIDQGRYEEVKQQHQGVTRSNSIEPKMEEKKDSRHGSNESLDRKSDGEVPSRPESRSMSRMDKIVEDDAKKDKIIDKEPPKTHSSVNGNDNKLEHASSIDPPKPPEQKKFLDLGKPPVARSPARSEGDNDSGVDESTQGNEHSSNGDGRSPRKISKSRTSSTTPTKGRSLSRSSKTPSVQSPDSNATTPGSTDKKKLPMNKIQVGAAPSPNLKVVKSKIGSLDNTKWKPGGGNVKIESKKLDFKNMPSKIEAKNDKYIPKTGEKKIVQQKLQWTAKSKIGSLDNATYKPKGGNKKIESMKLDFKEKAKPKIGSKENMKHVPGGGDVKDEDQLYGENVSYSYRDEIESKKLEIHAQSKVGSMDNVRHRPKGGDKKIFDDKEYMKQRAAGGGTVEHSLSGSQNSLPSQPDQHRPVADENLNQEH